MKHMLRSFVISSSPQSSLADVDCEDVKVKLRGK